MKYFIGWVSLFFIVGVTSLVYADTKVYFSPNGGCQEVVGSEIGKAQKTAVC